MAEKFTFQLAVDGVKAVVAGFREAGNAAEKELGAGEQATGRFSGSLDKLKGGVGGVADQIKSRIPAASGLIDKFTGSAGQAEGAVSLLGPAALAGGAAVVGLGALAFKAGTDFLGFAGEVGDFQRVAGTTAEDSSRWIAAFGDYGVSAGDAANLVSKFSLKVGAAPEELERMHIEILKNKDGTTDLSGTMQNAIGVIGQETDAVKRDAAAKALWGKQYTSVLPLIEQGADGLKQSFDQLAGAQIVNQSEIDDAMQFRLAMDGLNDAGADIGRTFGRIFAPAIADAATEASNFATGIDVLVAKLSAGGGSDNSLESGFKRVSAALVTFGGSEVVNKIAGIGEASKSAADYALKQTEASRAAGEQVHRLGEIAGETSKTTQQLAAETSAFNSQSKAQAEAAKAAEQALKAQETAMRNLASAQLASASAEIAHSQAVDATTVAVDKLKEAQDKVVPGLTNSKELTKELNDASRGAALALIGQATAADSMARKQADATGATYTARDSAEAQRNELQRLKEKFPELEGVINDYITRLGRIPRTIETVVRVSNSGDVSVKIPGGPTAFAEGGLIGAPSGQAVPIIAHGGEYVLTESETKAALAARNEGNVLSFGGGGGGMVFAPTINLSGSATRSDAQMIVDALAQYARTASFPLALRQGMRA